MSLLTRHHLRVLSLGKQTCSCLDAGLGKNHISFSSMLRIALQLLGRLANYYVSQCHIIYCRTNNPHPFSWKKNRTQPLTISYLSNLFCLESWVWLSQIFSTSYLSQSCFSWRCGFLKNQPMSWNEQIPWRTFFVKSFLFRSVQSLYLYHLLCNQACLMVLADRLRILGLFLI